MVLYSDEINQLSGQSRAVQIQNDALEEKIREYEKTIIEHENTLEKLQSRTLQDSSEEKLQGGLNSITRTELSAES